MHVFGEWKNSCSSKFVQLELVNKAEAKTSKKPCSLRFSLHKFVHLKLFGNLLKNVHCQGPCSLRPCISRPYCNFKKSIIYETNLDYLMFRIFKAGVPFFSQNISFPKMIDLTQSYSQKKKIDNYFSSYFMSHVQEPLTILIYIHCVAYV